MKKEDRNLVAKILNCSPDEVDMHMKQARQRAIKYAHKLNECKEAGHPNATYSHMSNFLGQTLTHMHCPTCGGYSRNPTREEYDNFWRIMREPITI